MLELGKSVVISWACCNPNIPEVLRDIPVGEPVSRGYMLLEMDDEVPFNKEAEGNRDSMGCGKARRDGYCCVWTELGFIANGGSNKGSFVGLDIKASDGSSEEVRWNDEESSA